MAILFAISLSPCPLQSDRGHLKAASDPGFFFISRNTEHGCLDLRQQHLLKPLGDICVSKKPWMDGLCPAGGRLLFCRFHFRGPPLWGLLLVPVLTHRLHHLLDGHLRSAVLLQARTVFHSAVLPLMRPAWRQERFDCCGHRGGHLWTRGKYLSQL